MLHCTAAGVWLLASLFIWMCQRRSWNGKATAVFYYVMSLGHDCCILLTCNSWWLPHDRQRCEGRRSTHSSTDSFNNQRQRSGVQSGYTAWEPCGPTQPTDNHPGLHGGKSSNYNCVKTEFQFYLNTLCLNTLVRIKSQTNRISFAFSGVSCPQPIKSQMQ